MIPDYEIEEAVRALACTACNHCAEGQCMDCAKQIILELVNPLLKELQLAVAARDEFRKQWKVTQESHRWENNSDMCAIYRGFSQCDCGLADRNERALSFLDGSAA